MAVKGHTIPTDGYSSLAKFSAVLGRDGSTIATITNPLPVDAIVTIDSMNLEAEMKTVSGHDLYSVPTVAGSAGTIVFTWTDISGFTTLKQVQGVENKTQGWIYNTGDATLVSAAGTTTLTLSAAMQKSGYPTFTASDEIEVVYRNTSRLTDKTQMSQITDGTDEATVNAGFSEIESTSEKGLFTTSVMYGYDSEIEGGQLIAAQIAVDNAGLSATPNVLVTGGIYKDALDTYGDNDAVPFHFDVNGRLITAVELNDYTDDSNEFTVATSKMIAVGGIATSDAVDAGDVGAFRMTLARNLGVDITTKDGSAWAANNTIFTQISDGITAVDVLPLTSATVSTGLLSVAGEIRDFDTTVADDPTPAIGILGESITGARPIHIAIDDSAMDATPPFLPVGGEYRAAATTYTDGDATVLQSDINGNLKINSSADIPTALTGGNKTVAVPGTAEALGASLAAKSIYIRAKSTNTTDVYVGDSAVDKDTSQQIILSANDSITIDIANRATVYVDAVTAAEGVDYLVMA